MRRWVSSCEIEVVWGSIWGRTFEAFFLSFYLLTLLIQAIFQSLLKTAAAGIQQLANAQHGGHSALQHAGQRRLTSENGIGIWQLHPGVSEFCRIKNVQGFEDSD